MVRLMLALVFLLPTISLASPDRVAPVSDTCAELVEEIEHLTDHWRKAHTEGDSEESKRLRVTLAQLLRTYKEKCI